MLYTKNNRHNIDKVLNVHTSGSVETFVFREVKPKGGSVSNRFVRKKFIVAVSYFSSFTWY
ncbi:hypothetical protein [Niallia sp. 03133]|uniref:hypothetical protein n=1 Tax=Niallia sp. 03133 TaxID=3458060 RepID=UPI00404415E6